MSGHAWNLCAHDTRQIHGTVRFPWDTINDDKRKIWWRKQHTISVCYWLKADKRHHTLNSESSIHSQRNRKTMHVKVMYAVRETTICTVTCTVCRGSWNPAPNITRSSSQSIFHREIMSTYRLCADVHVQDANMSYTQRCTTYHTKCMHTHEIHCCEMYAHK